MHDQVAIGAAIWVDQADWTRGIIALGMMNFGTRELPPEPELEGGRWIGQELPGVRFVGPRFDPSSRVVHICTVKSAEWAWE